MDDKVVTDEASGLTSKEKTPPVWKENCLFCNIAQNKDPSTTLLYEDDEVVVFKDHRPAAPHHYLSIPKNHIRDANCLTEEHIDLVEHLTKAGLQVLQEHGGNVNDVRLGCHWPPFRLVDHLHIHVMSPESEMRLISRALFWCNSFWFVTVDWIRDRLHNMKIAQDLKKPKL